MELRHDIQINQFQASDSQVTSGWHNTPEAAVKEYNSLSDKSGTVKVERNALEW